MISNNVVSQSLVTHLSPKKSLMVINDARAAKVEEFILQ